MIAVLTQAVLSSAFLERYEEGPFSGIYHSHVESAHIRKVARKRVSVTREVMQVRRDQEKPVQTVQWSVLCNTDRKFGQSHGHSPHRISAVDSLLFMRCVSFTLTGLFSAWRRGEASSAILTKPLFD